MNIHRYTLPKQNDCNILEQLQYLGYNSNIHTNLPRFPTNLSWKKTQILCKPLLISWKLFNPGEPQRDTFIRVQIIWTILSSFVIFFSGFVQNISAGIVVFKILLKDNNTFCMNTHISRKTCSLKLCGSKWTVTFSKLLYF